MLRDTGRIHDLAEQLRVLIVIERQMPGKHRERIHIVQSSAFASHALIIQQAVECAD